MIHLGRFTYLRTPRCSVSCRTKALTILSRKRFWTLPRSLTTTTNRRWSSNTSSSQLSGSRQGHMQWRKQEDKSQRLCKAIRKKICKPRVQSWQVLRLDNEKIKGHIPGRPVEPSAEPEYPEVGSVEIAKSESLHCSRSSSDAYGKTRLMIS